MRDHNDAWGYVDGFIPPPQAPSAAYYKYVGDRIGTFMAWLSDVQGGGATCFTNPSAARTVYPKKGAALFWININRRQEVDPRMIHGSCPVLLGTKWIITRWMHSYSQWKSWSCGLDTKNEFNIYSHVIN